MTGTTLNGTWRDLQCTTCKHITGFTTANLDEFMDKSYKKHYHCATCNEYTDQEFAGVPYELIKGERIHTKLNFDMNTESK
jgi:hypothetical protein